MPNQLHDLMISTPLWDEPDNTVASPLGAWLVLAVLTGGNQNELSADEVKHVEGMLGVSIHDAYVKAAALLESAPNEVSVAMKAWVRTLGIKPEVAAWVDGLAQAGFETQASIPTPDEANAWADEKTKGLIKEFPLDVTDPDLAVLLASAVATKISWAREYQTARNETGAWSETPHLLTDNKAAEVVLFREEGQLWAAHVRRSSKSEVAVVSVIAPDGVERETVQRVAYRVAGEVATWKLRSVPLSEVEDTDFLKVSTVTSTSSSDVFSVTLPAWDAESKFDLIEDVNVGLVEAAASLGQYEGDEYVAVQSAVASYTQHGFEAAAVTTFGLMRAASAFVQVQETLKGDVTFSRPYAVVAVSVSDNSLWDGLPLFSAWVTQATSMTE